MDALNIADGAVAADLGTGSGWFTVRLARRVGPNGLVYAEDIQPVIIESLKRRVQTERLTNVLPVLGTPTDPRLPPGRIDAVLIVGAYREMEDPATLLNNVARSLRPTGCIGIVDYMPGGGGPGPDPDDRGRSQRVDPDEVVRAATAAGLTLNKREALPFQFLLVFGKSESACR
jgi:ubiquinone/menaquinone biosynthesis C-methylase UbiE